MRAHRRRIDFWNEFWGDAIGNCFSHFSGFSVLFVGLRNFSMIFRNIVRANHSYCSDFRRIAESSLFGSIVDLGNAVRLIVLFGHKDEGYSVRSIRHCSCFFKRNFMKLHETLLTASLRHSRQSPAFRESGIFCHFAFPPSRRLRSQCFAGLAGMSLGLLIRKIASCRRLQGADSAVIALFA